MNNLTDLIATNGTWEFLKMQGSGTKSMAAQTVAFETGRQINTTLPDIKSSLNNITNKYLFNPLYYGKPLTNKIKTYEKDGVLCFKINDDGIKQSEVKSEVVYFYGEDETSRLNVATSILSNGDLSVKIAYKGNEYFYMKFDRNGGDGWQLVLDSDYINMSIPSNAPLDMIGLSIGNIWIGIQLIFGKMKKGIINGKDAIQGGNNPCREKEGIFYLSHKLTCNLPGILKNLITSDGRMYIWLTCTGTIEINALECCKMHDRNLWCSETPFEATQADELVVQCVSGAVRSQVYNKIKWYCFWDPILFELIYMDLVKFFSELIALFFHLGHDVNLLGYGGINRDSCLCKGKKTTYCCEPEYNPRICCQLDKNGNVIKDPYTGRCIPRNLCECLDKFKIPKSGCKKGPCDFPCYHCHYICEIDEITGQIKKTLVTDQNINNPLPCCCGTGTPEQRKNTICAL